MADAFGGDPLRQEEDFTHLSGKPFYAHLARLGRRRWWRDRRMQANQERLAGIRTARRVRYPGESATGLSFAGLMPPSAVAAAALQMHLPTPVGLDTAQQEEEDFEPSLAWYRGRDFVPARVSKRAWHTVDHPAARVFRGSDRASEPTGKSSAQVSPMERIGARLGDVSASRDPVLRDLAEVSGLLSTRQRRRVERVLRTTEHLPTQERVVLLRKVLGGGAGARVIRFQVEKALATEQVAGLDRALSRRLSNTKGLRPVLRSSPSVEWSLPQPVGGDVLEPTEALDTGRMGRRAGRARGVEHPLSRSPVQDSPGVGETQRTTRPSASVMERLFVAVQRELTPADVAPRIVEVEPGRFVPVVSSPEVGTGAFAELSSSDELLSSGPRALDVAQERLDSPAPKTGLISRSASPADDAALPAPIGLDSEAEFGVEDGEGRRSRRVERVVVRRDEPAVERVSSVLHRTSTSASVPATRWAAARLDAPAVSTDFAASSPLLSALPVGIRKDAEDTGRFLQVDVDRDEAVRLGVRPIQSVMPEMSVITEPDTEESVEEESASPFYSRPKDKEEATAKRPKWDRSAVMAEEADTLRDTPPVWPRQAPDRAGWQAVDNASFLATSDHAWFRTPSGVLRRSKGFRTPDGRWVSSPSYRTPQRSPRQQGLRFEPIFPSFAWDEEALATDEPQGPSGRLGRRAGWGEQSRSGQGDFSANLSLVSQGQVNQDSPAWSDRAVGGTKIRASSELIRHLAQAKNPEEIIRLIVDKGQDLTRDSALATPVVEVIKQIKSEAAKADGDAASPRTPSGARVFSGSGQRSSRAARRMTGFTPLRGPGAKSASGMGEDKVMKLAGKLRSLIHLAEVQKRRDEARQYARLSADEAPAVAAAPAAQDTSQASKGDVEALIQEVLSAVNREMELRRERRQEDGHEYWW